jgi:cytoplasmic iron level regulating protein YaaA (DUF328/UPF0246 family)
MPPTTSHGGGGIAMILSPAKTLDLSPRAPPGGLAATTPDCRPEKTAEIAAAMKNRGEGELAGLLSLSANLAKTAADYWDAFDQTVSNEKSCIYAFSGAAYQGLQAKECSKEAIQYMQENLRIIDPVYGLLRPLDQIQPYRLEMATKGVLKDKKIKLHEYWSEPVTKALSDELRNKRGGEPVLLNLASDEYAATVDEKQLPENARFIKVVFREEGRVVSVHAKRARGLMVRYVAENQLLSLDDVKDFDVEGYSFQRDQSDDATFVFDREKQPKAKRPASKSKATGTRKRVKK